MSTADQHPGDEVPTRVEWDGGTLPLTATREEWLEARHLLLQHEKALTRQRDAVAAQRRAMPLVEVTKNYVFTGTAGPAGLLDLFDGRRQLIVCHFMFHPDWHDGCASCTAGRDDELGPRVLEHLRQRDTEYVLVSRADLGRLERWRRLRGWDISWYSTEDGDFSYDMGATVDARRGNPTYNYRDADASLEAPMDLPGRSCFVRVGDRVFHTYSHFARATEETRPVYSLLDLTVLGRQEDWELPHDRVVHPHPPNPAY